MKLNKDGIDLIKKYESFKADAYPDPGTGAEPITIGYGTTVYPNGIKVKMGDKITEDQALEFLTKHCENVSNDLLKLIPSHIELTSNQFSALVSLIYNIGIGNFKKSTLNKHLQDGKLKLIPDEIKKWTKANGKTMQGLIRRRIEEIHLFDKLP